MNKAFMSVSSIIAVGVSFTFAFAMNHTAVERGKTHFNNNAFAGGKKACNTCHDQGRGLEEAGVKTKFTIMGGEQSSLEEAINVCIINGTLRSLPLIADLMSSDLDGPPNQLVLQLGQRSGVCLYLLKYLSDLVDQLQAFVLCVFIQQVPDLFLMLVVEPHGLVVVDNTTHASTAAMLRNVLDQEDLFFFLFE